MVFQDLCDTKIAFIMDQGAVICSLVFLTCNADICFNGVCINNISDLTKSVNLPGSGYHFTFKYEFTISI